MMFLGREAGQHARFAGGPERQQRVTWRREDLAHLLHRRAERLELPRRIGACRSDLGIDARIAEIGAVGDLEPTHAAVDAVEPVAALGRQRIGIPVIGPGQHVQHQGRVAHMARHRPDIGKKPQRRGGVGGDPAKRSLYPEDAGKGRRDADRPGAIGAEVQRRDAGGAGGRGTGAAAARGAFQIPRVAGDAGERAVADRLPAEFRGRGLTEDDGTSLAQPRDGGAVLRPILVGIDQLRPAQGRKAAHEHDVLDRDRHAVDGTERRAGTPALLGGARRRQGAVAIEEAEGVEAGLQGLRSAKQHVGRFDWRERLFAIQLNQCLGRGERDVAAARHVSSAMAALRLSANRAGAATAKGLSRGRGNAKAAARSRCR